MFDLTLSTAQQELVAELGGLTDELRTLGRAAELDRTPSTEAVEHILAGRYALPTVEGGIDPLAVVLAAEQYGYGDPGVATVVVNSWFARLLGVDNAQAPARLTSALLFEGFGRNPSEYRTVATRTADGWSLTGRKEAVLHPGVAERSVAVARDAEGELGVFVLQGNPPGYTVERDDTAEGKLGLRAAHSGAVRLQDVPAARIDAGDHMSVHRSVALVRLARAGIGLGSARASIDYAADWAKQREAFGKVIASYQGVAFVIADLGIAYESARLLLWDTVTSLAELTDVDDIEQATGRAVARAGALATDAGRQGVNLLGVHGIVTDHPVERWYRGSAVLSTVDFDPTSVVLEIS